VLRYLGIPAGLEFGTLLEDLAAVSRGTTTLKQESRTKLASLTKPVHVQVFVTPTCPYCPQVASLAHQAAVECGNVTADVIEISEFPDLAAQYHVHGVPKVVMNDMVELVGAQPEAAFVDAILQAAA
jgi:glutaredoxin-like protein